MNAKKIVLVALGTLFFVPSALGIGYTHYRKSHFAYGQVISGKNVSLMSVDKAYEKLTQINEPTKVTVHSQEEDFQFDAPVRYHLTKDYLKEVVTKDGATLLENPQFEKDLLMIFTRFDFKEDKGRNAFIQYAQGKGYEIVPEIPSTVIDKKQLTQTIRTHVNNGKQIIELDTKDFFIPVEVAQDNPDLVAKLKEVNAKIDKKIVLKIKDQEYTIPRETLINFVDESGMVHPDNVYSWIENELNAQFSTKNAEVHWKNPQDNKTYAYTNNGYYGWDINFSNAQEQIVNALNDTTGASYDLTLQLDGNTNADPKNIKDFVYINLLEQHMYVYRDNKKVVETWIITGRDNKGTATVPGFHTIGYKERNSTLRGVGLDGIKYAVPVSYWEPLISKGGYYTGIGIHDSNNKDIGFGNPNAWQTTLGSNGCINTPPAIMPDVWNNTEAGMAVIIQGDLYQNSPGAYDKPVEFGTVVE